MSPFVAPLSRRGFTARRRGFAAVLTAVLAFSGLLYAPHGFLAASATAEQGTGADDFERANGPLGADWVADRGAWSIVGGSASSSGSPGNDVATYRPVQLGSRFAVAADVTLVSPTPAGREWAGIAANVHGTSSSLRSYVLRVTTAGGTRPLGRWQLLTVTQSTSLAVVKSGEFNAPYGTPLTVSLTRDATVFDIGVSRRDTGAVLVEASAELAVVDPNRVGGYAGLYSNGGNLRAQSFSVVSSTPSVSPPGPLDCVKEGDSYEFPSTDDVVLDESAIGRSWAGMSVTQRVLTEGDDQYVAYYNVNRDMVVAHRSLSDPAAVWTQKVLATRIGWDSHNYVTMGLDRDGQLHVSGNMHNVPLIYFRTDVAGDVTSLKRVPNMVSAGTENSVTYPEFVNRNDGSLVFSHRNGGSGDGVTYFNVYDENTHTWTRLLDVPLFDGSGTASNPGGTWNAYFEGPTLGPDGLFHLLWVWRDTPDAATNSVLSYARSENLVDWFDSAGNPLDTPFKYGDGDIVDPVPNGGGLLNGNAKIGFDAGGAPLITYHKYDETGASQVYAARAGGTGEWDVQQISDWDGRAQFGGTGSLTLKVMMRGAKVLDNGDVRVDFLCSNDEQSIVIDNDLRPLAQVPTPSLPNEVTGVRGTYPGLHVNFTQDLAGPQAPGTYYLRWETLPHNGDQARTSWPTEGGEISVVLVGP